MTRATKLILALFLTVVACVLSYRQGFANGVREANAATADVVLKATAPRSPVLSLRESFKEEIAAQRLAVITARNSLESCKALPIAEEAIACLEQANSAIAKVRADNETLRLTLASGGD
jgi:hypothetical protein